MIKIILLDIDGVLVYPGGYRAALRATVNHFIGQPFEIDEDTLTELEGRGISCEWDMIPLLLASYWTDILLRQPMQDLPPDVLSAGIEINRQRKIDPPTRLVVPEFPLIAGQYPAETAFRAGCFLSIPYDLRKKLLTDTRNIRKSHTMRVLQHYTLGSEKFTEIYNLPREFETEPFLLTRDKSLIDHEIRTRLFHPSYRLAAFTSRPCAPRGEFMLHISGMRPKLNLPLSWLDFLIFL